MSQNNNLKQEDSDVNILGLPKDIFPEWVDKDLKKPIVFTMIVLATAFFGSMGLVEVPERITALGKNPFARFLFFIAIAFTATSDMETAIYSVVLFLIVMYLVRTPSERAKIPYFI